MLVGVMHDATKSVDVASGAESAEPLVLVPMSAPFCGPTWQLTVPTELQTMREVLLLTTVAGLATIVTTALPEDGVDVPLDVGSGSGRGCGIVCG